MRWEFIAAAAVAVVLTVVVVLVLLKRRKRKQNAKATLDAPAPKKAVQAPPEVLAKIDAKLAQANQVHQASKTAGGT